MVKWWYIICLDCGFNSGGVASDQESEAAKKFNKCPRCQSSDIAIRGE